MIRKLVVWVAPVLAALMLAPAPAALASSRGAGSGSCSWVQMTSRNPATGDNLLTAVTALSTRNVWAVGQYFVGANTKTLIEHWNGRTWKVVKSPNAGATANSLNSIYAASGTNIWAVGSSYSQGSATRTLIEHWNGRTWKVVHSPNAGALTNELAGVRGTSASDVWAVGYTSTGTAKSRTLILHWNGRSWKIATSANGATASNNMLAAVRPLSAGNAWAVGDYLHGAANTSLIEHWSNGRWRVVYSPNGSASTNELEGVLATSGTNAWAVGWDYNPADHADRTLIERWNGRTWRKSVSPNAGTSSNDLYAIGGASATDIYAVGDSGSKALIVHWNGRRWGVMPARNPGAAANALSSVFALSPGNIYAVGLYSAGANYRTLIEHCR